MTGRAADHDDLEALDDLSRARGARPPLPADPYVGPLRQTEDCICGGEIMAEVGWEAAAVDEHNRSLLHQIWRSHQDAGAVR